MPTRLLRTSWATRGKWKYKLLYGRNNAFFVIFSLAPKSPYISGTKWLSFRCGLLRANRRHSHNYLHSLVNIAWNIISCYINSDCMYKRNSHFVSPVTRELSIRMATWHSKLTRTWPVGWLRNERNHDVRSKVNTTILLKLIFRKKRGT